MVFGKLLDKIRNQQERGLEGLVDEEHIERGIDPTDNSATIISDSEGYMLTAEPIDAGQSAEVRVRNYPLGNGEIDRIAIYEDGKEIASKGEFFIPQLSQEIQKQEEGTHEYHAVIQMKSGEQVLTDKVDISFNGQKKDFLPSATIWDCATDEAGKATKITVGAEDIGDNKGIRRITLFEDGVACRESNQKMMVESFYHDTPGTHEYHAEIEDIGGQVVETDRVQVSYLGEAYPPSVRFFEASPREAGMTTRIIANAKDPWNLDNMQGIESIALYEDGEKISEHEGDGLLNDKIHESGDPSLKILYARESDKGETLLYNIARDEPATHLYHVEVTNRNGVVTESDALEVSFLGHDFPPAVRTCDAQYDTEKGSVMLRFEGDDKRNVRDDAGISDIALYEDGRLIAHEHGPTLQTELERPDGPRTYHAVITNNSGYSVRTDEVTPTYTGE